jgi:hypothetical protein
MNIFSSIFSMGPQGQRMKKAKFKLERAAANKAIADIGSQQALRKVEDPREQAHMKQSLFGRGIGKSTIADQDTARLTGQQSARNAALERAMHVAVRYKQYLKKRQRYERKSVYAQALDTIVSAAMMVGTMGMSGGNTAQSQGTGSPMSYSGSGGMGDYDYGGGSFV